MSNRETLPGRMIIPGRITDDVTTCDCCGRVDLKATVEMQVLDADGNVAAVEYYGRTCASRHFPGRDKPRGGKVRAEHVEPVGAHEDTQTRLWRGKALVGRILHDNATTGEPEPYAAVTPAGRTRGHFATYAEAYAALLD